MILLWILEFQWLTSLRESHFVRRGPVNMKSLFDPVGRQRAKTVLGLKEATLRASAGLDVVKRARAAL